MQKIVIICATIVLIATIGAWVYIQKQDIAEKDRALVQQSLLTKYRQEQENERLTRTNCLKYDTNDPFGINC